MARTRQPRRDGVARVGVAAALALTLLACRTARAADAPAPASAAAPPVTATQPKPALVAASVAAPPAAASPVAASPVAASLVAGSPEPSPAPAGAASPTSSSAAPSPAASVRATSSPSTTPQKGVIAEPAPRPTAAVRVQSRYAQKAKLVQVFGAVEYLSRGDFYNSPGAKVGAAYCPIEPLGVEVQIAHYWSSLDAEAERVKQTLGAIPDSHAPGWMALVGARYSIGYGKVMVGGLGGVIHFEPQAFVHLGVHDNDGDIGPSGDAGLGFLVFLTPRLFTRIDAAITIDREQRSGRGVTVWGTLPSLGVGGLL